MCSSDLAWQWAYIPGLLALMVFARLILDGPASPGVLKVASTASKYAFPVYAIHFTLLLSVTAYMEPLHVHLNGARGCAA